jgi:hypothetical protein
MRFLIGLMILASSAAACAHTNSATVCSESRDLRCMTTPQCAIDPARGCQVCSCSPAFDPQAPANPGTPPK